MTSFDDVYKVFLSKITDDMYLEISPAETQDLLEELLKNSIFYFEFPRVTLSFDEETKVFDNQLTSEEINILATYMICGWLSQQLANVDLTRMIYTGADFKATSQANHMSKLNQLKEKYSTEGFHLQRLYKRRIIGKDGKIKATLAEITGVKNDY